ncbi:hypothetical protein MASR2M78_12220 [Treponema sp.]
MAYWEAEYDGSLESLYYLLALSLEKGEVPGRLYSSRQGFIGTNPEPDQAQDLCPSPKD